MQERQDQRDYPTVDDPSLSSTLSSAGNAGTSVSALEPYIPPNVPHGLPHVVRFATLSSMDLPLEVRFLIIMLARFANVDGVASVAVSTLCELCRIGSKNTVERWIGLAADVGILRKEPGKGGKDRKSNSYTFLGASRDWAPLPVGRPDTNPIVALAHARRLIEELQPRAARVDEMEAEVALLRAEVALLRNGGANGHPEVGNGEDEPPAAPPSDSYETAIPEDSQESHGAIGHSQVTNGLDEGQEYLARRARVETLVLEHRTYYERSFDRRGLPGAVEFFSRSAENEQDLIRQVGILDAGRDPRETGTGPPPDNAAQPQARVDPDRYEVGDCPDCGRPFATHGGAEYCTDCTERRRRESEA